MKTIKTILIVASLICASAVSTLSAQQDAQSTQKHEFSVAKGDTVVFTENVEKYCTGESPSKWVYGKTFVVRQLGTKRFPDGVLLMPILSWVYESDLVNVNGRAQEAKEEAQARLDAQEAAEKAAEEAARQARQDSIDAARQARQDSIADARQARQDSIEAAREAEAAAIETNDTLVVDTVQPVPIVVDTIVTEPGGEQAKGDSIHSKQDFKHSYDRFTIGAHGGVASLLHKSVNGKSLWGGAGILDLQYAHYWAKDGRPVDLGLLVGVGIGYAQGGMKSAVDEQYTIYDPDPAYPVNVEYTIHVDEVKETDGQLQLEIPLMFSLVTQRGFFFNVGPKFMLPLYTPYTQTLSDNENTYISAYFREIGVPVTNEVVTGIFAKEQYKFKGNDNGNQFSINVLVGAELGWEWVLKSGNSFGLGLYANYGVYNSFKKNANNNPLVEIQLATESDVAHVTVNSLTKTYATGLGYFDAGLKLAYHLNFPKKRRFIDSKLF